MLLQFRAGELVQHMADDGEARMFFGVRTDAIPRGAGRVRCFEHVITRGGVLIPLFLSNPIQRADFEAGEWVGPPLFQASGLFFAADIQPQLDDLGARFTQHGFKGHHIAQEIGVLFGRAKAHDRLNSSAVIPRAVEDDDFPGSWQMGGIALEMPLSFFAVGGFGKRDDAG